MALGSMSDHELRQRFEMLKGVEHHKNELILVNTCPIRPRHPPTDRLTRLVRNFSPGLTH